MVAALLAGACGSGRDTSSTPAGTAAPSTAPPTAAPAPPTPAPTTAPTTTAAPTTTTLAPTTTTVVLDPGVVTTLAAYGDWTTPTFRATDDRSLVPETWTDVGADATKTSVSCTPSSLPPVSRTFAQFPAFGFTGTLAPGLLVEGSSVETGDLRVLPLARRPLTLVSSLASADPTRLVDSPDSSTLATAVAELKRDADARLTGIDVVPGDITYTRSEVHSFEESSLEMNVSLRYSGALVDAGVEAAFEQESRVEKHTIQVRMIQPMYAIRAALDEVTGADGLLDPTVTRAQVEALVAAGSIGDSSPPLVVDEVTYGRVMYFTMTSTTASSAQELMLAVDAANARWEGSGSLTTAQSRLLSTSEVAMVSHGGDQGLALAAIRSGDLRQFFGPANTTTAAPLSFSLRTLDGDPVDVTDTADLQSLLCERRTVPYSFDVDLSKVRGKVVVTVNGSRVKTIRHRPDNFLTPFTDEFRYGSASIDLDPHLQPGSNTVEIAFTKVDCVSARVDLDIRVDGSLRVNRGKGPTCAFLFTWTYDIDTRTGSVVERP